MTSPPNRSNNNDDDVSATGTGIVDDGIREIVDELRSLAKHKPLKGLKLVRARFLMQKLKERDYNPGQIAVLVLHAWSASRIKQYIRQSASIDYQHRDAKKNVAKLMVEVFDAGVTLDHIREYQATKSELATKYDNLSIEDIVSIVADAKAKGVSPRELVQRHREIHDSKMTIPHISEFLEYKRSLVVEGFTIDMLRQLSRSSSKYGGLVKVQEAINRYHELHDIEQSISLKKYQEELLGTTLATLRTEVSKLNSKRYDLQDSSDRLQSLEAAGFDTYFLIVLQELAERYHKEPRALLEEVREYDNLQSIRSEVQGLERKRDEAKSALDTLIQQRGHHRELIEIYEELTRLGFNRHVLKDLYQTAERYVTVDVESRNSRATNGPDHHRQPQAGASAAVEYIKELLSKYNDLAAIESKISEYEAKKRELDADIKKRGKKINELNGQIYGTEGVISALIQPLNQTFNRASEDLTDRFSQLLAKLGKIDQEYARKAAEADRFERELKIARLLNLISTNLQEAARIVRPAFAFYLLEAAQKVCVATGQNPKIKAPRDMVDKYTFLSQAEVEALDIIDWAKRAVSAGNNPTQ